MSKSRKTEVMAMVFKAKHSKEVSDEQLSQLYEAHNRKLQMYRTPDGELVIFSQHGPVQGRLETLVPFIQNSTWRRVKVCEETWENLTPRAASGTRND